MAKREFMPEAPWQSIRHASRVTGLSQIYLRTRCREGSIPVLMVGGEYRIHVPLLLEQLEREAAERMGDMKQ